MLIGCVWEIKEKVNKKKKKNSHRNGIKCVCAKLEKEVEIIYGYCYCVLKFFGYNLVKKTHVVKKKTVSKC